MNSPTFSEFTESSLTSGQLSKILGVAARTVCKWYDANEFPNGYKIPNPSSRNGSIGVLTKDHRTHSEGDRRIPVCDLLDFLVRHKMPVPKALIVAKRVYAVGFPSDSPEPTLKQGIDFHRGGLLSAAVSLHQASILTQYVIYPEYGVSLAFELASLVPEYHPVPVVVVSPDCTIGSSKIRANMVQEGELDWNSLSDKLTEYHSPKLRPVDNARMYLIEETIKRQVYAGRKNHSGQARNGNGKKGHRENQDLE